MSVLTPIHNQRGIALLYLIILFVVVGVLISGGVNKFGSQVLQTKINESRNRLESSAQSLAAWAERNGRLPTVTEYSSDAGALPVDSWGKSLVFAYYSTLTHDGSLCGLTRTTVSYNNQDVACILLSGGEDYAVDSSVSPGVIMSSTLTPSAHDLFRVVTLEELKNRAGCYGSTPGGLRILNNELPSGIKRKYYSATVAGDGGVAPLTYSFSGLSSAGLMRTGARIHGISTAAKNPYAINVTVTDSQQHSVKRTYVLQLMSSCKFMLMSSCK